MKNYIFLFFSLFTLVHYGQAENDSIDLKYLEDQIYLSLNYTILINKPDDISQNGFSGGLTIGFIKDIPFNENRTYGLGIGLGYAYSAYIQNLKINEVNGVANFDVATDYTTNNFKLHSVEMPIEFRWRNSTPEKYKFWRVYGGVKFAYLIYSSSKYDDDTNIYKTKNISEFTKFQYGLILSAGYSTWNINLYYGLNSILNNAKLNDENVNLNDISIGLKFYIM